MSTYDIPERYCSKWLQPQKKWFLLASWGILENGGMISSWFGHEHVWMEGIQVFNKVLTTNNLLYSTGISRETLVHGEHAEKETCWSRGILEEEEEKKKNKEQWPMPLLLDGYMEWYHNGFIGRSVWLTGRTHLRQIWIQKEIPMDG